MTTHSNLNKNNIDRDENKHSCTERSYEMQNQCSANPPLTLMIRIHIERRLSRVNDFGPAKQA